MRVAARPVVLLLAALLLSSCSVMQAAYNNAGIYLRWRATTYLDVHEAQLEELEGRIERFHAWHRRNALPEYARLAEDLAARLARGLSRADLQWGYDAALAEVRHSVRAAAENGAGLLDKLNAGQIEHLEKRLAEDNRRFAKEFLRGTSEERKNKRTRRNIERLEEWVGELTQAQADRVKAYSERAPLTEEMRDRERKRLQGEFLALVRERQAGRRLAERAAGWERGRDPAFEAAAAAHRAEYFAMLLDIERALSPEQRSRAIARLRGYAADFRALAAERGREGT